MRSKYIAACLAAGALNVAASGVVHAQQPATGTVAAQHPHTAMQALTDAQFVQMMLQHHQQGLEMVRFEQEHGSSAAVKELAAKIGESQERDIAELKTVSLDEAKGTSGHAEHHKMMEQQSQKMMEELKSKSGEELDRAFLEHMAKHHQMAISMTEDARLQDPELKKLAEKMLESQRQELAELKKHLGDGSSK
jgi:uncharacterized protein (DUF305 family)